MSSERTDRRDFNISFNSADRGWAEWIASELEAAGYTTFFQPWDFRPGNNFVLEMHRASLADRTIAVLSPDYLNAPFTQPEWAASLGADPTGAGRKLIPIRVRPCEPNGLLRPLAYVDVFGLSEADARDRLIGAVAEGRPKPESVPFPVDTPAKPFPGTPPARNPSAHQQPKAVAEPGPGRYAALSLFCFLAGAGLRAVMLWNVQTPAALGLNGKMFYLVLILMGLAAAGFLFGVLHLIAHYRGKPLGGTLQLGGPIVAAAVVVWGGLSLPPAPATFDTTVFVHGRAGPQDPVLRGKGTVVIDLNGNRRPEAIDGKGAAYFPGIPAEFRGQEVPISVEAEGFERSEHGARRLTGESLYLPVRRIPGRLNGMVTDEHEEPVANAELDVEGLSAKTDARGRFDLAIPSEQVKPEMTLRIYALRFQMQTLPVVPGANEIQIRLERAKPEGKQ